MILAIWYNLRKRRGIPMKKTSVLAVSIAVIVSGCASQKYDLMMQEMQGNIKNVQERTSELNKAQSESVEKIEELSAKVVILEGRLSDISRDVDEIKTQAVKPHEEPPVAKEIKREEPKEEPVAEQKVEEPKEQPVAAAEEKREEAVPEEKVSSPDVLYKEGQDLLNAGKQEEAISVFKSLVKHYPKSSLADNALYWMGEIYFSNKDYPAAVVEFNKVVNDYPGENKAPDALLKLGATYQQMGEKDKATAALKELIARYPKSEAAKKTKSKAK